MNQEELGNLKLTFLVRQSVAPIFIFLSHKINSFIFQKNYFEIQKNGMLLNMYYIYAIKMQDGGVGFRGYISLKVYLYCALFKGFTA